ncbi:hypothetical protein [Nocardia cyriacigeorgica]|uniref:hypothetical protein n=1 Tax=Nocardia cyriacigeorgica TaxID=135487 RepID=UPI002456AA89|nr:hypothetical protein [Nocardia cyriacigeorgica]
MAPPNAMAARRPSEMIHRISVGAPLMAAALLFGVVGCASTPTPLNLADGKQIAASCPEGRQLAGRAAIDVSTHMRAIAGDAGRLDPVQQLVRRVMICGGHLRVDAFSGSSAATAGVFDADLHLPGATENARLRREPAMTEDIMKQITENLPKAAAALPLTGSDILAQFGMSTEYFQQLDPDGTRYTLDLVFSTDGAQSEGISLGDTSLTVDHAEALATRVTAPNLSGASIQLTNIGKTANPAPSTSYVDALKAFYGRVCQASGAARCTVVTDGAGR